MDWQAEIETLKGGRVLRVRIRSGGEPASRAGIIQRWRHDPGFCEAFARLLSEAPFEAYFWETPPVTRETLARPFEFVLVDSPELAGLAADRSAFAGYFDGGDPRAETVAFPNLGGDAFLVAPTPRADLGVYPHLAAFSRGAPAAQQQALWKAVGRAVDSILGDRPLWLSTSGLGVAWLHVRLDTHPKYYTFPDYRQRP